MTRTATSSNANVASLLLAFALLSFVASTTFAVELTPPKKHVAPSRLEGTLAIDGKLDDAAWQKAKEHTGFEMPLGIANRKPIPEDQQTFFRVLYDDKALYFGIRCNEPKMSELVAAAAKGQHDAAMWSDDDVELFLDPVGDRREYYQLTVNTDGTMVDLYYIESGNTGKGGWSSDWQAAAHKDKDFWSVEVAVPFGLFHNRPSNTWVDNWVFSISRTRMPAPQYYSQFSPANRYHDVANFGTLGPIPVDKARYNLYAESPRFMLEPAEKGYNVTSSLQLENRGDSPFEGTLTMEPLAKDAKGAIVPLKLAANTSARVELPGCFVMEQGKWPVLFRAKSKEGQSPLVIRFDDWFTYTPLTVKITQPNYRNNIYATQQIDTIKGFVSLGIPLEKVKGCTVKVSLCSTLAEAKTVEAVIDKAEVPFELPAKDLPEGTYTVRAEILRPAGDKKLDLITETEVPLRKLPHAPAVEVRVDDQGNLLVNGSPVFIRGWYGSMGYIVSASSLPQARLPHSTNFMMGASDFEQHDLNLYTLVGLANLVDEAKAKLDQPIDGDLKAKVRALLGEARLKRNVIGYYISDEPECRGLSPVFLKSLKEFIAEEDPYRFCKIVSRSPAEYIEACDVMCPHPYMDPQLLDDGTRKFGAPINEIHKIISEGVKANDGSKALWSMPQTFTYGGLRGQNPTFAESRWFAHTSIACGAKGLVPFIFNGYWNHLENRIAMDAVFEELTFLAPAWSARDTATEISCDNPEVDVIAKVYRPRREDRSHTFIVAANQSSRAGKATITVPALAKNRNPHLIVIRENRVIPVDEKGAFTDDFPGIGIHVYTTLEVLPNFKSLEEIEEEIRAALGKPAKDGNLLAKGKVKWAIGEFGRGFQSDSDLADGVTDAAAWFPVYEDRTQCLIVFEKPVTFSRVEFHSPTIKAADLDIWVDGVWKTIHQWKDQYLPRMEWRGKSVTTDKFRIHPTAQRQGYGSWVWEEITELGVYR